MSINTIINNPVLLSELATALAPDFPDTGITSLVGDSNITCSVTERQGNVNLDPDITISKLTLTSSDVYTNININNTHAGGESWSLYNNADGAAFPNSFNIYNNTTGHGALNIANSDNTVRIYYNETVDGTLNIKKDLQLNGNSGTSGQVLTSAGAGILPTWSTISGNSFASAGVNISDDIGVKGSAAISVMSFPTGVGGSMVMMYMSSSALTGVDTNTTELFLDFSPVPPYYPNSPISWSVLVNNIVGYAKLTHDSFTVTLSSPISGNVTFEGWGIIFLGLSTE